MEGKVEGMMEEGEDGEGKVERKDDGGRGW